jgi:hypothetical protein
VTVDRRTVVLGVAAAAAVAAAVSVTVFNRTSGESKQRRSVTAYIQQVNGLQNRMHAPLTRVLLAYRDFTAQGGPKKASTAELHQAVRTMERLDRELTAVPAPPEAKKLRLLLLSLVGRQAAITREVERMAAFTPRFAVVLARARAANSGLGKALAAVPVPKAHKLRGTRKQVLAAQRRYQLEAAGAAGIQAAAVDAYDERIKSILSALRGLRPPAAFAAGYRAQVRALNDVVAAGGRLSAALRASDRSTIPLLGRRFTLASREAQTVSAQRAQIAAIRAYNARARGVNTAAGAVQTELLRLQKTLP